jgi:hypothetical protein
VKRTEVVFEKFLGLLVVNLEMEHFFKVLGA